MKTDEVLDSRLAKRRAAIQSIDRSLLSPLVRKVLETDSADILDWSCDPIQDRLAAQVSRSNQSGRTFPAPKDSSLTQDNSDAADQVRQMFRAEEPIWQLGRNVYRVAGRARVQDNIVNWSFILKVQDDENQRERRAYESGLLSDLPEDLNTSQCYGAVEQPDGDYWLWLEEVTGEPGQSWSVERLGLAARHLGQFNGAYLAGRPVPTEPWLGSWPGTSWPGGNGEDVENLLSQLKSVQHHPLIARAFPQDVAEGLDRLWVSRPRLLAALQSLPKTLAHSDIHLRNLFSRPIKGRDHTVLIDRGAIGTAPLGVEVHKLTASFRYLRNLEMGQIRDLGDLVFSEYLSGLREAGWRGDTRQLRLGYAATVSLCHGLGELRSLLRGGLDERARDRVKKLWGDRPIEENMERRGELLRFMLELAREAEDLVEHISLN
ncbi:MAG: phosphotransferase [Candidatus Latescibacteria bacterium]|nr:phosphotransferase [Candidatus Latescibacterota bacterium]